MAFIGAQKNAKTGVEIGQVIQRVAAQYVAKLTTECCKYLPNIKKTVRMGVRMRLLSNSKK